MKKLAGYIPQFIILAFLVAMLAAGSFTGLSAGGVISDSLVRLVMNGVLVMSMIPMLNAGLGVNFGMPVGVTAGLLGLCLAVNFGITGFSGLFCAIGFSIPFGIVFGWLFGLILGRVKGREEITGTFIGFSFVSIMNLFWAVAPFTNSAMLWPIGGHGLRPVVGLNEYFAKVLNKLWVINLGSLTIPLGMITFFAVICAMLYLFSKTKTGMAIRAVGENEFFSRLSGVNVKSVRTLAVILSTVLAALGICVYAQSYGFIELYSAPLMMAFPAASAVFLGGSTQGRTSILQAIIGTFLFQSIYVISGPVANALLIPEVAEVFRLIITNAIILYALLYSSQKVSQ